MNRSEFLGTIDEETVSRILKLTSTVAENKL